MSLFLRHAGKTEFDFNSLNSKGTKAAIRQVADVQIQFLLVIVAVDAYMIACSAALKGTDRSGQDKKKLFFTISHIPQKVGGYLSREGVG